MQHLKGLRNSVTLLPAEIVEIKYLPALISKQDATSTEIETTYTHLHIKTHRIH